MRLWVKPDQLAKLGITVPEIVSRDPGAEHRESRRARSAASRLRKGQEFTYSVRAQGRLTSPEEFGDIVVRETPDGGIVRVQRRGARRAGRAGLQRHRPPQWQAERDHRRLSVARLQRRRRRRRRQEADGRSEEALSRRTSITSSRSTPRARDRRHEGNRRDAADRDRAGDPGGLPLPARLARHADSAAGGAGVAGRHIRASSRCSDSPSTRSRCSAWCWRSAWWWTTRSWWWRPWSATSKRAWRPKQAALKAMEEISGPVIGIALVLSAVFVPTAFIPGITGRLYQQFAVTIAISVILSAFNALTLSPALAALLLKPKTGKPRAAAAILRLVQPRVRARHRRLCPLVRGADPQERGRAGAAGRLRRRRGVLQQQGSRPASCRTKTRATCSCNLQLPNAASLQRTEAACREGREDPAATRPA